MPEPRHAYVRALAVDPTQPSTVYATAYLNNNGISSPGLFRSVDAGQSWSSLELDPTLALGSIGFVIGAALILNIKDHFPRRVVLEADNVAILGAIVIAVCLVSSALGVRAAMRIDPATALGG